MKVPKLSLVLGLTASLAGVPAFAQHDHPEGGKPPERLGTVHFVTSCGPAVEKDFDRSVALLHSFWFSAAIKAFQEVASKDPGCAMAQWGIAMSWWGNPFGGFRPPKAIEDGTAAVGKARGADGQTGRGEGPPLREGDGAGRGKIHRRPGSPDLLRALPRPDQPPDRQDVREPPEGRGNPGERVRDPAGSPRNRPLHYSQLRRAVSRPEGARRRETLREDRARRAPRAPHAVPYLHPRRLLAGVDRDQHRLGDGGAEGQSPLRGAPRSRLPDVRIPPDGAGPGGEESARADSRDRSADSGQCARRRRTCARALGAARSGNPAAAAKDVEKLNALAATLKEAKDAYWTSQVEIQGKGAAAWVAFAEGRKDEALTKMREAVAMEDLTEKSAISPGPIKPARELLGEMLLERGKPAEALPGFGGTMKKGPNRF